jgi:hypothetical protein
MLIDKGRIELERNGTTTRFVHRDEQGQQLRTLQREPYQSAALWQRAVEDWLANFHEDIPLKRLDGTVVTVGDYEAART